MAKISPLLILMVIASISKGQERLLVWPATGVISSLYGWRYASFHHGIDITDSNGRCIRAAESGEVVYVGEKRKLGKTLIIDHGGGMTTVYAHNAKIYVRRGMQVLQGQKIAKMGASGRSTGIHLHFEVRINGKTVDPLHYLEPR